MGAERIGHWRKPAAEREYTELAEVLRAEGLEALRERGWTRPPTERDVATPFGSTHVFHWEGDGPRIVLLHGAGTSSLMWLPVIGELVGCDVYAIDGIGEPGGSRQTEPVRGVDDVVAWLDAVLDALAVRPVHLAGASYGAWIALNAALRDPAPVLSLTLVEPALAKVPASFWFHGIALGVALALPRRLRTRALHRLHAGYIADADPRVIRLGRLGLTQFRRGVPRSVVPVSDGDLAAVATPTLLLLAEHSEVHRATAVLARAEANMPSVEGEIVPGTAHTLPLERPELVGKRIRTFVETVSA